MLGEAPTKGKEISRNIFLQNEDRWDRETKDSENHGDRHSEIPLNPCCKVQNNTEPSMGSCYSLDASVCASGLYAGQGCS